MAVAIFLHRQRSHRRCPITRLGRMGILRCRRIMLRQATMGNKTAAAGMVWWAPAWPLVSVVPVIASLPRPAPSSARPLTLPGLWTTVGTVMAVAGATIVTNTMDLSIIEIIITTITEDNLFPTITMIIKHPMLGIITSIRIMQMSTTTTTTTITFLTTTTPPPTAPAPPMLPSIVNPKSIATIAINPWLTQAPTRLPMLKMSSGVRCVRSPSLPWLFWKTTSKGRDTHDVLNHNRPFGSSKMPARFSVYAEATRRSPTLPWVVAPSGVSYVKSPSIPSISYWLILQVNILLKILKYVTQ